MLEWKEGQVDVDSGTSTEAPTGKSVEKKDEKAEKEQKKEEAEEAERAKKYGCLCRVTCEIYNRNDHGEISKETFDNSVSSYKTELSRISGAKMSKPRVPSSKSANKVEAFQWETPQGAARLYVSTTTVKKEKKVGRNDPCPCGSGKKYKNCCYPKDLAARNETSSDGDAPADSNADAPLTNEERWALKRRQREQERDLRRAEELKNNNRKKQ